MLSLIRCPFHSRVTAVARKKKPGHSAKSAGGRLHLNTNTPQTQRSRGALSMPLSRHSMRTYQETSSHATRQRTQLQSSQLVEPVWTDSGLKSGISVYELIPTLKKKAQAGNEWSNILPNLSQARKKPSPVKMIIVATPSGRSRRKEQYKS